MEEYYDSLVSEIGSFSHVMGLYFREARVEYKGEETVKVVMEDSCLSRKNAFKLEEALNRIFRERCGVQAVVKVSLEERRKRDEAQIPERIRPLQGAEAAFAVGNYEEPEIGGTSENAQAAGEAPAQKLSFKKKEENGAASSEGARGGRFTKNGSKGAKKTVRLKALQQPGRNLRQGSERRSHSHLRRRRRDRRSCDPRPDHHKLTP